MGPRTNPEQQSQSLFVDEGAAPQQKAQPELEAAILRFWDTVRKSADIIVTLRQENARLQAKAGQTVDDAALREELDELRSVNALFATELEELRLRVAHPEETAPVPVADVNTELHAELDQLRTSVLKADDEIRRLRAELADRDQQIALLTVDAPSGDLVAERDAQAHVIEELRGELSVLRERLTEAEDLVQDHQMLSQQLMQVRTELETRARLMQELQTTLMDRPNLAELEAERERERMELEALRERLADLEPLVQRNESHEEAIAKLEQELGELKEDLDRAMRIIERYRAAGLRYVEDPEMDGQMPLFMQGAPSVSRAATPTGLSKDEVVALADRLDDVAKRIAGLFGIS